MEVFRSLRWKREGRRRMVAEQASQKEMLGEEESNELMKRMILLIMELISFIRRVFLKGGVEGLLGWKERREGGRGDERSSMRDELVVRAELSSIISGEL